ncbi:MAG: hypothetical protein ACOH2N_01305 [Devosia sp.]
MHIIPQDIHNGMPVRDKVGDDIGTVEDFRFSENEQDPHVDPADIDGVDRRRNVSIIEQVAKSFAPSELPEELRDRLLMEGFVRVHISGPFAGHRYVLPEQIQSASDDALVLNLSQAELAHQMPSYM